jgi:hypothetical protein
VITFDVTVVAHLSSDTGHLSLTARGLTPAGLSELLNVLIAMPLAELVIACSPDEVDETQA